MTLFVRRLRLVNTFAHKKPSETYRKKVYIIGLITDSQRLTDGVNPQTASVRGFPFQYEQTVYSYYIASTS